MSWLQENYEKAALGGAVAILAGVAAVSFLGGEDVSSDALKFDRNDDPSIEALTELTGVLEARSASAQFRDTIREGREVDLFVGQPLYVKDGSDKAVDLYDSGNVHQGIPNEFWRKYSIDPSFVNSAERDFDKDGFTNREEFEGKTDPSDKESYPNPLAKLVVQKVDVLKMQMRWSVFNQDAITLTYQDTNKRRFNQRVNIGDKFFKREDDLNGRFTLLEKVEGQVGPNGRPQDAYSVKDNAARFKGTPREKFMLWRRGDKPGGFVEVQDRSVTFRLNALGQEGESFEVAEFDTFALPYDSAATERPYKVESITPQGGQFVVAVSYSKDGEVSAKEFVVNP